MEPGCAVVWGKFFQLFPEIPENQISIMSWRKQSASAPGGSSHTQGGVGSSFNLGELGKWIASRSFQTFL